ncbi:hypothetical protein CK203_040734 [Vitis vinifera]|uniref:Retrotransposon gag domain-containing protein n=1 Tax=Vitis vinifera TaxID=29760 RepID=A0A438HF95_VITVI|nr:hypothetical protein CK203_040734 [Vitis vinifera]
MIQSSVQFGGLANDDPNLHISNFLEICDTFKHNGVIDDAIRLRLFPFSLNNKAKAWLISLAPGTITIWDGLVNAFLAKYFPPAESAKMRNDITNFSQQDQESLYEACERFKDLLRKCPHHGLPVWLQVQTFYNSLHPNTQTMVDAASGRAFINKTPEEGYQLIEVMASNNFLKSTDKNAQKRIDGVYDIDAFNNLAAQVIILAWNVKLEAHMKQIHLNKNQGASIRNLEHQVREISKLLTERTQGALPSITETNPKEHVKAITLRSGKELNQSKEAEQQANKKDTLVPKEQDVSTSILPSLFLK